MTAAFRRMKLGDLIDRIETGVSVRSFDQSVSPGQKGVLKVSAVNGGRFNPAENKLVRDEELQRASTHPVAGCTLVSRANTLTLVGESAYIEESCNDVYLPDKLWQLHPKRSVVDPYWFSLLLASPQVRNAARLKATGTSGSMKNISQAAYLGIVAHVPALDEQRSVAATARLISRADLRIERAIAAKRTLKRGLMQEMLTGRRRFATVARADAWQFARLGDVAAGVTRRNVDEATERVLTCSGENGLIDQREFFSKIVAGDSREDYFLLRRGEFAYNRSAMSGYPFGAIKRLDRYEAGVLSTLNICFRLTGGVWESDFAVHFFESGLLNEQLGRITRVGSRAHGLLNVTKADFFNLSVPVPPREEQARIAALLNTVNREISLLERERAMRDTQKRSLLNRLVPGKLSLTSAEPVSPELADA